MCLTQRRLSGTSANRFCFQSRIWACRAPGRPGNRWVTGSSRVSPGRGNVFGGVVLYRWKRAPRSRKFSSLSDDEAALLRKEEQKAARIGSYGALVFMNYVSRDLRRGGSVVEHCARAADGAPPAPYAAARRAPTHSAAAGASSGAAQLARGYARSRCTAPRSMARAGILPVRWRWLLTAQTTWNCKNARESSKPKLRRASATTGREVLSRRAANATMNEPNTVDKARALTYAMDLTLSSR